MSRRWIAVIPSHANEVATKSGKAVPGSKTDAFLKSLKVPAHTPLSGRTMEFDANGHAWPAVRETP